MKALLYIAVQMELYSVREIPYVQGWYKDVPNIPLKVSQEEGVWF